MPLRQRKFITLVKEIGLGATVKIVHQLLAGVHIAAGAEAMALASKAGIPPDVMYDVVTNAAVVDTAWSRL